MIKISNDGRLEVVMNQLMRVPGKIPRVMKTVVRRTLRGAAAFGAKQAKVAFTYRKSIRKDIKVKISGTSGEMTSRGRKHLASSFKHRKPVRRKPVYLRVEAKKGSVATVRRAFMKGNLPLMRVGIARKPIRAVKGYASAQMLGDDQVAPSVEARIRERLGIEVESAVKAAFGGFI